MISSFIREHDHEILSTWAQRVQAICSARNLDPLEQGGHERLVLAALVQDMDLVLTEQQRMNKSHGYDLLRTQWVATPAELHARQRMKDGFTASQIAGEYRALRADIVRLWVREHAMFDDSTLRLWTRFHEAMDQQLLEALLTCEDTHARH